MVLHDALVRKLSFVERLSDIEIQAAVSLCRDVRVVPRRQDIIAEGAVPNVVHIVLSGWAARYNVLRDGSRCITAILLPGDICDIHGKVLGRMDHSITALTECQIAFVNSDSIDEVTRSTPVLTRAFWRSTLIDEAILRRWLVNIGRRDAFEMVAHLMCELHLRARLVGLADDDRLILPLTQDEIGDATGLTPVHVNRMIKLLRERNLMTIGTRILEIPDVPALRQASGFDPNYLHLLTANHQPSTP